jgi:ABC-type multidrug transport system permease subunit
MIFQFSFLVPTEKHTILKETFNRWYTIKSYYLSMMIVDLPLSILSCLLFSVIIYAMTGWPLEIFRFSVFFIISLLIVLIASTSGLIIGTCFNVIVSTYACCDLNYIKVYIQGHKTFSRKTD